MDGKATQVNEDPQLPTHNDTWFVRKVMTSFMTHSLINGKQKIEIMPEGDCP